MFALKTFPLFIVLHLGNMAAVLLMSMVLVYLDQLQARTLLAILYSASQCTVLLP